MNHFYNLFLIVFEYTPCTNQIIYFRTLVLKFHWNLIVALYIVINVILYYVTVTIVTYCKKTKGASQTNNCFVLFVLTM